MTEGKGHTTIEFSTSFEPLFAKVSFDNRMSEMEKRNLKDQWNEFKKQVDAAIKIIEGVPFQ